MKRMSGLPAVVLAGLLPLVASPAGGHLRVAVPGSYAALTDSLTYTVEADPGNINVNRMPGVEYLQKFIFTVTNPGRVDYHAHAPSCQLFDVMVMPVSDTTPIWQWSKGKAFCQHTVDTTIASGNSWFTTVRWSFAITDVPDGKYHVEAVFTPTGGHAIKEFELLTED